METRLLKEARHLFPVWLGTLALMLAPRLLWGAWTEPAGAETLFAFGLGCVLMAGLSFGTELQHRTLGLLLSQPLQRSVLWREKMLVLGTAMALSFGALLAALGRGRLQAALDPGVVWGVVLIPLCAFCGAPWLTLLTRSGLGGVVFATVLPAFIAALAGSLTDRWIPSVGGERVVPFCLVTYCGLAYWRGYCRFQRLEVRDGPSTELVLPARVEGRLARALGALLPAGQGPFPALLRKELRLQQMSFVLAGVFSTLVAVAGGALLITQEWGSVLLTITYAIYVILLPFIVGAMAVAEERTLGVAEWQLTLPASRFKQWSAKMLISLPTSLLLGVVLPAFLMIAGELLFSHGEGREVMPTLNQALLVVLVQLLVTSVAVYAGSCCTSTLRAIMLAFGIIVAGLTLFVDEVNWMQRLVFRGGSVMDFYTYFAGRSWTQRLLLLWMHQPASDTNREQLVWALSFVALFLLIAFLQVLAFANFRRSGVSARWFVAQLVGLFLLLAWLGLRLVFFTDYPRFH